MRFNSLLFIAFALFSTILALPFAEPRDDSLSKRNPEFNDDLASTIARRSDDELFERDNEDIASTIARRSDDGLFERDDAVSELFRRARPKVTFSRAARSDINRLAGNNPQARRTITRDHKTQVRAYMRNVPGAHSARVQRGAHAGGTNPNEPRHATVILFRRPQQGANPQRIRSTYTAPNGQQRRGNYHHVRM